MDLPVERFLECQYEAALRLAEESDLVEITPIGRRPVQRYRVRLRTRGLIQTSAGGIEEAEGCAFAIYFGSHYLRTAFPFEVVQWIGPREAHHPNIGTILDGRIAICVGPILPGTPILNLLEQVNEIWGYVKYALDDALSFPACEWARHNQHRFPIDARPLRRSAAAVDLSGLVVEEVETA